MRRLLFPVVSIPAMMIIRSQGLRLLCWCWWPDCSSHRLIKR